jgi:uncharacterized protein YjbJ (UPF0337 family)
MSMNEYKDKVVEGVMGTVEGVKSSMSHLIGQENLEAMKETMEGVKESVTHIFSAETVEGVKETMAEEAAIVRGYKDELMGGVKETVGHLMGDEGMEKEGHKQKLRGEAEVAQHRAMGDRAGRESEMNARYQMGSQAVVGEIGRMGGFKGMKARLNHVDTRERKLSDFIGKQEFHLKKWDVKPLLNEIRSKRTLKHVETKQKGLLFSIPIDKKEFHLRESPRKRMFEDLNKEGALRTLREVPQSEICDKSAPRLDLASRGGVSKNEVGALLSEIKEGAELKHVQTKDKSKPLIESETPIKLQKLDKGKLLSEIKEGAELKHVQTKDKSKPSLDKETHLKTWDRQGFLDEVRQGTDLKHI